MKAIFYGGPIDGEVRHLTTLPEKLAASGQPNLYVLERIEKQDGPDGDLLEVGFYRHEFRQPKQKGAL